MKTKWPSVLYVREEYDRDNLFFIADNVLSDVVEEDGPTAIGVYELKNIVKATKEIRMVPLGKKEQ